MNIKDRIIEEKLAKRIIRNAIDKKNENVLKYGKMYVRHIMEKRARHLLKKMNGLV